MRQVRKKKEGYRKHKRWKNLKRVYANSGKYKGIQHKFELSLILNFYSYSSYTSLSMFYKPLSLSKRMFQYVKIILDILKYQYKNLTI